MRRALSSGVLFATSGVDAQRVQLINAITLTALATILIVEPYAVLVGDWIGFYANLGAFVWLGLAYWLNAVGRAWGAALVVSLTTPLVMAAQLHSGGIQGGGQLYLLPGSLLPFLAFPSRSTRSAIVVSLISALIFVVDVYASHGQAEVLAAIAEPGPRTEINHSAQAVIMCLLGLFTARLMRRSEVEIDGERARSEALLLDLFPRSIARRLQRGQPIEAERHGDASVLFCRILGLDAASRGSPEVQLRILGALFATFDDLCARHGLEKIKSFGDSYMAASGLPEPRPDHAEALTRAALDMAAAIARARASMGAALDLRIGIHSGPVVAGVLGRSRATYDLWGDVVNTAQRMEAHGVAGAVQISAATFVKVNHRFACEAREPIPIKGKLPERTYVVRGAIGEEARS